MIAAISAGRTRRRRDLSTGQDIARIFRAAARVYKDGERVVRDGDDAHTLWPRAARHARADASMQRRIDAILRCRYGLPSDFLACPKPPSRAEPFETVACRS